MQYKFWHVFIHTKLNFLLGSVQFSSVTQSCLTLCDPMDRSKPGLLCPSPTSGVYPNSCPSSQWCHPAVSSSVIPFSSCLQPFSASESLPMGQFFLSCCQRIGASASVSVFPMNIQDWFPLGLTDLLAVQGTLKHLLQHHSSKASILWRSAFFMVQLSHPYMTTGETKALLDLCWQSNVSTF